MSKVESTLSICLPGETGWELWKQSAGKATLAQSAALADDGSPAAFKQADVLAYPVLASFVLPTLAQTGDAEIIDSVVEMNLEKNGLKVDSGPGRLHRTRIVDRGENLSLAVTSVLHESVTPGLPAMRPTHYELSPYLYYLPDDSIVIWKELGKLVVCVTKGDSPVYFHALTAEELNDGAIQEIENLLMQLDFQGFASDVKQAVVWTDAEPASRQALANALHLPLRAEPRPAPSYTETESSYQPTAVALAIIHEAKMRKIRNIVIGCVGTYLLVAGTMVGLHIVRLQKNDELERKAKMMAARTAHVQPTFDTWNLTAPLRDKDGFVAETLRRLLESVASRAFQIRITSVRISTEKPSAGLDPNDSNSVGTPQKSIEIKGESRDRNIFSKFRNHLNTGAETKMYVWAEASPETQRGDMFPFTIRGTSKKED